MSTSNQTARTLSSEAQPAGNGRMQVNVSSWSRTPQAAELSNFAEARFVVNLNAAKLKMLGFDQKQGIRIACYSVEGFVQSLKCRDKKRQRKIARLFGKPAKHATKGLPEEIDGGQRLAFLNGNSFAYFSSTHRALIEYSIWKRFESDPASQAAMLWTGDAEITHNLGKYDGKPGKTSLPKQVFTRILRECREMIRSDTSAKSLEKIVGAINADTYEEAQYYVAPSE